MLRFPALSLDDDEKEPAGIDTLPAGGDCMRRARSLLMRAVDECGKAAGADDLFRTLVIAGEVGLFLVLRAADEALQ
jgi:hypothetical protein